MIFSNNIYISKVDPEKFVNLNICSSTRWALRNPDIQGRKAAIMSGVHGLFSFWASPKKTV